MTRGLSAEALRTLLSQAEDTPQICTFDEIDSTNNEAKRMALEGFDGTAVIAAASQSAGRGRMGRSFYSPHGTGAYFTILYRPSAPLSDAVRITGATSVAVMRAIRNLTGKQTQIKWVNDLYLDGRKVCGILAESLCVQGRTYVIVGIGVNLSTETFPGELGAVAGSVGDAGVTATELIAASYNALLPYLNDPHDASWLEDYRAYSCVIGKNITWQCGNEIHRGTAMEIDCDGALWVRDSDGNTVRLATGEISLRIQ